MAEAIRDQWAIVAVVVLLVALVIWRMARR